MVLATTLSPLKAAIGDTPLHCAVAATGNNTDVIRILLGAQGGANALEVRNGKGQTPGDLARAVGNHTALHMPEPPEEATDNDVHTGLGC